MVEGILLNFVENPRLIIIDSVVLDCLMHHALFQSVDNLNVIKVYDDTASRPTGNIGHLVRLNCHLDDLIGCYHRQLHVVARLRYRI